MNINLVGQDINRLYNFDGFALIKIETDDETYFKVFGSNSGGYLHGDSWRVNSGVSKLVYNDLWYGFIGYSGSCYVVPRHGGRISMYNSGILDKFLSQDKVTLVDNKDIIAELTKNEVELQEVGAGDE